MKLLNTKLALSALGVVAMLTSPAFAQKRHHVVPGNNPALYSVVPSYNMISGYGVSGSVVEIPNPDRYGVESQR
jgi:hypothetical protein